MSTRRVLIVDDEEMVRLSLRDMLELGGYAVVGEAADGVQAFEQAHALRPDVILMDINMPRQDGIQAAAEIMAANPVPVVFLTAYADTENVARAHGAGAFAYLVKPCRQADLAPAIETAVARFAQGRQQQQDAEAVRWAMETVRRLSREIAANPDIAGVVTLALRCVLSALQVPGAALLLVQGDYVQIRAQIGLDATYASAFRVAVGESIFGETSVGERTASFTAADEESRRGPWPQVVHPFGRCGSALAAPLRDPGVPETGGAGAAPLRGCLCAYRAAEEAFTPAEAAILSTLANELVVAFQVAQARHAMAWRCWRYAQ